MDRRAFIKLNAGLLALAALDPAKLLAGVDTDKDLVRIGSVNPDSHGNYHWVYTVPYYWKNVQEYQSLVIRVGSNKDNLVDALLLNQSQANNILNTYFGVEGFGSPESIKDYIPGIEKKLVCYQDMKLSQLRDRYEKLKVTYPLTVPGAAKEKARTIKHAYDIGASVMEFFALADDNTQHRCVVLLMMPWWKEVSYQEAEDRMRKGLVPYRKLRPVA